MQIISIIFQEEVIIVEDGKLWSCLNKLFERSAKKGSFCFLKGVVGDSLMLPDSVMLLFCL